MGKDTRAGRNSSHHIQLALFPRYIACMDCRGHHLFQGTLQVPLPYSLFSRGIGNHSVHTEFSGLLKSDDMEHARNLSLQHKGAVRERAALFVSVTAGNDTERKGNGRKTQTLANRELQGKVGKRFLSDGKVRPQAVSEKIILAALRYFSIKSACSGLASQSLAISCQCDTVSCTSSIICLCSRIPMFSPTFCRSAIVKLSCFPLSDSWWLFVHLPPGVYE